MDTPSATGAALVLGRALHAPWNEGTRVIGRNFALAAQTIRPVHVVSLTQERFRQPADPDVSVNHVYTQKSYGAIGDWSSLRSVMRSIDTVVRSHHVVVAHLIGLPLALAPWLSKRGIKVVNHITLAQQVYMGAVERARGTYGWRVFDRWIDRYAPTSPALVPLLVARGIPKAKIKVIPASIDTQTYQPRSREESRRQLELSDSEPIFLYIGTLSPERFPVDLIRSALQQTGHTSTQRIQFFAFAPALTHAYNLEFSENVRQRLSEISNVDVQITLGDLSDTDKTRWYNATDALIIPFMAPVAVEPPLTMLEAMSCRAMVIATPHANRSNIVINAHNGFTFQTAEELSGRLMAIINGGARNIQDMRDAARRIIEQDYSQNAVIRESKQLWSDLGISS